MNQLFESNKLLCGWLQLSCIISSFIPSGGAGDNADSYDIRKNQDKYKNLGAPEKQEPQGPRRNMPKKKGKKK